MQPNRAPPDQAVDKASTIAGVWATALLRYDRPCAGFVTIAWNVVSELQRACGTRHERGTATYAGADTD